MKEVSTKSIEKVRGINEQGLIEKLCSYKRTPGSFILFLLVGLAALITFLSLFFLVGYILVNGIPYLSLDLFSIKYTTENVSLMPAIINTLIMAVISLIIAVPIGICSAVYLVEYAKRDNKFIGIIQLTTETLSGIPSIVYGLFGFLFFVTTLGWGLSLMAGACTMAIMILPLVMRTTEEALKSVPNSYREGSFGLGAGRLRTVVHIVLPSAMPGILAGVILSIGRIVGETAALMFTAGTLAEIPKNLFSSGRTLALHMYALSSEGLHTGKAFATAVVLLVVVIIINWISNRLAKRIGKNAI